MGEPLLTSRSATVKAARKLTRRASRLAARVFLAEGPQAVREALASPGSVVEVFASAPTADRHPELRSAAAAEAVPWRLADADALAALSETVTPQGVVAVCRFVDRPVAELLAATSAGLPRLVVICVDVRDPGNAGTVIRCADAVGADAVVLAGTSVDPYNGKAVRASAGSLFHVPIAFGVTVPAAVSSAQAAGLAVLAADGAGATSLDDLLDTGALARATAWLFGNEAHGLSDELHAVADDVVRIPVYGRAESLNLATAAGVVLYASARAQRAGRG